MTYRTRLSVIATAVVGVTLMLSALPPGRSDLASRLSPPTFAHWLGTDQVGRDIAYRSLAGLGFTTRGTVEILLLSTIAGVFCALLSGAWYDRTLDRGIVLVAVTLRAFPTLLLVLVFAAIGFSPEFFLALYFWIPIRRLLRSALSAERTRAYVLNARLLGFSHLRALAIEALPNVVPGALPYLPAIAAEILSVQAALEFLGFGPPLDQPSLGGTLLASVQLGFAAPWTWLPSLALLLALIWSMAFLTRASRRRIPWVPLG